ncbi:MAG: thiol reductant ABC exporter subunit CydD [Actinomycetota bacterium]|nr:thiol reductant ABC exporter subunit CydD [Actinomycetota bacterium]
MSIPAGPGGHRPPFDRRLWSRVRPVRSWTALSVVIGIGLVACLVVQALLLGHLVAGLFERPVDLDRITPELIGLVLVGLARSVLLATGSVAGAGAANRVRRELRHDGTAAVLGRGPAWLAAERSGELAVTLGRGLDALDVYVGEYLPRLVLAVVAPVVLLGVIAYLDWLSALILLAALAVVPVFMVLIGRLSEQRLARRWRALGALGAQFLDVVEGLATLRAFGRARRQEAQITEVTDELRRTTLAVLKEAFLSALVLETLAAIGTALVAVPLALRLLSGHMTLAPALSVLVLTPEVFLPLRRASADFHASAEGLSAIDRIFDILEPSSGDDACLPARAARPEPRTTPDAPGSLVAADVSLRYGARSGAALDHVDLEVVRGERVALLGPSGAGKSSLLGAILGLVPLESGSITYAGVALAGADPRWWRSQFTYVPQRPHLFPGTLEANLRLGGTDATASELAEVLEATQLAELVARLPEGLATDIGEQGRRLSTGERQRVALGRALLRREAQVVLLDEPTAHVDPATEAAVVSALDAVLGRRSLLVATHRPALVCLVDRVVRIADGQLAALSEPVNTVSGPHLAAGPRLVVPGVHL